MNNNLIEIINVKAMDNWEDDSYVFIVSKTTSDIDIRYGVDCLNSEQFHQRYISVQPQLGE